MDKLNEFLGTFSDGLYTYVLIALLVGAGLYFTIRTRAVQFRLFPKMVKQIFFSRGGAGDGISSFQAFAIGLASRVGTGNIAGVAMALVAGGPGAIFWMWVVALLGMATAFVEATLAQLFKIRWRDGTFRGGPAFYIHKALGSWGLGAAFAVFLIFSFGISFEMVQANTIATTLEGSYDVNPWISAIGLVVITIAILLGGIKRVAKVSEIMAPLMAVIYVALAIVVILLNLDRVIPIFQIIFESAFGLREAVAGTAGGMLAALLNGARRGLFSNEAGMGSAPNAASTATVSHPVKQGLIQSMGVFVDTVLVCSATAFIVLNANSSVYTPGVETPLNGAQLTISSITDELGNWVEPLMILLIFVFAYSSIIGNFVYAEINMDYLTNGSTWGPHLLRGIVTVSVLVGAVLELGTVWTFADITMAFMAIINIISIAILGKWAFGALRDFEKTGGDKFIATDNPNLPGVLPTDVWVEREVAEA